jgi:hypothetical protein
MRDLSSRELWVMAPVLTLVVALGIYPKPLLDVITPSVNRTLQQVHRTDPVPTRGGGDVGATPAALPVYAPGTSPFKPGGDGRTPQLDVAIGAFK